MYTDAQIYSCIVWWCDICVWWCDICVWWCDICVWWCDLIYSCIDTCIQRYIHTCVYAHTPPSYNQIITSSHHQHHHIITSSYTHHQIIRLSDYQIITSSYTPEHPTSHHHTHPNTQHHIIIHTRTPNIIHPGMGMSSDTITDILSGSYACVREHIL